MNAIKVLIVDDSALVRKMLSEIVDRQPDMEAVGAAPDPLVAREMISDRRVRLIKLTDEGAAVVKRNREISEQMSGDLLDGIGSDAVEQCADLMHELRIRLQADREDPLEEPVAGTEPSGNRSRARG